MQLRALKASVLVKGREMGLGLVLLVVYLGEVVHTLLEGVHDDIIKLCQGLRADVHVR